MIRVHQLTQMYPSKKGIFDVSFTIKAGEIFGFLGPNGSGKTTTIRGLLGQMNLTEGSILINGLDPRKDVVKVNQQVGYLPGEIHFFNRFTGKQFLDFLYQMRQMKEMTKREALLQYFELDETVPIKKMSKGMKQKLALVAAFMHDPQILILDEPTSGLDPLMQNRFLSLVIEEKARGKTILMSSHIFEEIEKVCDRALLIKEGRVMTIEDFTKKQTAVEELYIVTLEKEDDNILKGSFKMIKKTDTQYELFIKDNLKEALGFLSQFDVVKIENKRQSIEDIFMMYYGDEEND